MVKVAEQSLQRYAGVFAHSVAPILRHNAVELLNILGNIKSRLAAAKQIDGGVLNTMRSATVLAERLLHSTEVWDKNRLDVLDLAFRISARKGMLKDENQQALLHIQWTMGLLSDWQNKVRRAADCRCVVSSVSARPLQLFPSSLR